VNSSDIIGEFLYTAYMRNNSALFKMLLDPRTNLLNIRENNVLIEAIKKDHIESVKTMISHPATGIEPVT
jgi:hypothetical protein